MRTMLVLAMIAVPLAAVRADHGSERSGGPTQADLFQIGPNSAELIIGKWAPANQPGNMNAVIEFTRGGKINFIAQQQINLGGSYRFLSANRVEITIDIGGQKQTQTITIKRLDATRLTAGTDRDKNREAETLMRVK